mmetsp:Transcript_67174/g.144922  ORF Transcript_67174/g.144922 Transcript_67174/m.144922 type:complete len:390 (-) Transcript_67174:87-1256(-)
MIHVFNCASNACSLPGKACTACGKMCDEIECKECKEACNSLSQSCTDFLKKPLGWYVLLAVILSVWEIVCLVQALTTTSQEEFKKCKLTGAPEGVSIHSWIYCEMGSACVNLMFAIYVQNQLFQRLQDKIQQNGETGESIQIQKADVKEAFSAIFWEDIGVCLYVFFLIASFYWSYMGSTWISGDACDPGGSVLQAAALGSGFFWFVVLYTVFWWAYLECASSVEVQPRYQPVAAAATSMAMGGGRGGAVAAAAGAMGGLLGGGAAKGAGSPGQAQVGEERPKATGFARACTAGQIAKLLACLGLDMMGSATYLLPGIGEGADLAFAPAQAMALKLMFKSNFIAFCGFSEEILPFTDFIPMATIAWVLDNWAPDNGCTQALGIRYEGWE